MPLLVSLSLSENRSHFSGTGSSRQPRLAAGFLHMFKFHGMRADVAALKASLP